MKILVTGSSGHLGEALCRTLQKKNIDYIGIDIKAGVYTQKIGSIADKTFVEGILQNIEYILHTATLHKPHIATHSKHDFIRTNTIGTLHLLEGAKAHGIKGFIYTSTTSTFGDSLTPQANEPAAWITEEVMPIPKNIYGVTKNAAEDLCRLFYRNHNLPCIILKTSRFFPEEDDKALVRKSYSEMNSKANEFLNRRVDLEDAVAAHLCAINKVIGIGFQKYIISATSPFTKQHLKDLHAEAPKVVSEIYPEWEALYCQKGWNMPAHIDRVYVNTKARNELDWSPKYDFKYVLECLEAGTDFRSPLSLEVGAKGYHNVRCKEGPYPVVEND